jgi:cell division protein FtsW (lipid II flippase)
MNPLIRIVVIVVFLGILVSLGSALYQLSRVDGDSRKMVRALTVRIGLSIALFLLLMLAWRFGFIEPHGIQMPRPVSP